CEVLYSFILFLTDTATTALYTLSLHDALPIWSAALRPSRRRARPAVGRRRRGRGSRCPWPGGRGAALPGGHRRVGRHPAACSLRSEEHTSELQSRENLVCRLLLEKKNKEIQ